MAFHHIPVLLTEVLDALAPRAGGVFADGTLGGGGHSEEILRRIGDTGVLYGIDRDPAAIAAAAARLGSYPGFVIKAPAQLVAAEKEKLEKNRQLLIALDARIAELG